MAVTILAAVILMAAYFLILYAGVGLIQDKRFFGSAPKENLVLIPDRKEERFRGAHVLGWSLGVLAVLLVLGAIVFAAWDGIKNGFGFPEFFVRFLVMLYLTELYDIFFFDWVLLCNSDFFAHFYPEVKGAVGPQQFGYNKKTHILHFVMDLPICAVLAWICTWF